MNVVGTGAGHLVEVQGTAEGEPFSRAQLDALVDAAQAALLRIHELQRQALRDPA
jgi:ribonuclease PH